MDEAHIAGVDYSSLPVSRAKMYAALWRWAGQAIPEEKKKWEQKANFLRISSALNRLRNDRSLGRQTTVQDLLEAAHVGWALAVANVWDAEGYLASRSARVEVRRRMEKASLMERFRRLRNNLDHAREGEWPVEFFGGHRSKRVSATRGPSFFAVWNMYQNRRRLAARRFDELPPEERDKNRRIVEVGRASGLGPQSRHWRPRPALSPPHSHPPPPLPPLTLNRRPSSATSRPRWTGCPWAPTYPQCPPFRFNAARNYTIRKRPRRVLTGRTRARGRGRGGAWRGGLFRGRRGAGGGRGARGRRRDRR